jgi:hypothetical protein
MQTRFEPDAPPHALPQQLPQLWPAVQPAVSGAAAPQVEDPAAQVYSHTPALQVGAAVVFAVEQTSPQALQLLGSVCRFASQPLYGFPSQFPKPAAQVTEHVPPLPPGPEHDAAVVLAGRWVALQSLVLQLDAQVVPAPEEHTPDTVTSLFGQTHVELIVECCVIPPVPV